MITDNDKNYNQDENNFPQENQSYADHYLQENYLDENETAATEVENLDTGFTNAVDRDDFESDFDENELKEEDSRQDEEENYNQEEIEESETFADDGYKID